MDRTDQRKWEIRASEEGWLEVLILDLILLYIDMTLKCWEEEDENGWFECLLRTKSCVKEAL